MNVLEFGLNILEFIASVKKLDGTHAVYVETIDDVTHVSTFVSMGTEELRHGIYACERKLIDDCPDAVFDFHVREAALTDNPNWTVWLGISVGGSSD